MNDDERGPLLDLGDLSAKLRRAFFTAVVIAFVSAGIALVVRAAGLSQTPVSVLGVFLAALVVATVVQTVVLVARSALKGADRAQKRGQRLSGDDVGLLPTRRERDDG